MDKFDLKKYLTEGRLLKENTFTSNPNIKKLKKGLTVRITNNKKNTSGPGTFTFGSASKIGKIISIDKNEVTVEIDKKPIIITPVGSNGNMGGDFEIVNESKGLNEKKKSIAEGKLLKENRGRDIGTPEELKSFLYSKQSQIVSWVKETLSEFGKVNISWEEDIKQWIADDAGEITPSRFNLTSDDFNNRGYDEYMFEDVYKEFVKSTYDKFFSKELSKSSSTYSKLYPGGKIIARRDLEGHDNSFNKPLKVTIKEGTVLEIPNQLTKRGDLFCDILKGTIIVTEEGENREYGVGTKVGLVEGWKSEMYELGSTADKDWINYPGPSAMD